MNNVACWLMIPLVKVRSLRDPDINETWRGLGSLNRMGYRSCFYFRSTNNGKYLMSIKSLDNVS